MPTLCSETTPAQTYSPLPLVTHSAAGQVEYQNASAVPHAMEQADHQSAPGSPLHAAAGGQAPSAAPVVVVLVVAGECAVEPGRECVAGVPWAPSVPSHASQPR